MHLTRTLTLLIFALPAMASADWNGIWKGAIQHQGTFQDVPFRYTCLATLSLSSTGTQLIVDSVENLCQDLRPFFLGPNEFEIREGKLFFIGMELGTISPERIDLDYTPLFGQELRFKVSYQRNADGSLTLIDEKHYITETDTGERGPVDTIGRGTLQLQPW